MSLPWYPKFPREFLASPFVAQLSFEEIGIYTILMDYAWLDDLCSIPADREQLANLVKGASPAAVERVLQKWVPHPDAEGRLINKTLYAHWLKANEKVEKARRAVQVRWAKPRPEGAPKKQNPKAVTADEFTRVDEMVEIWNACRHPALPAAQYAAQARAQGTAMAKRIRANPWLHEKFEHVVRAAVMRYGDLIANGGAKWLHFSWFAKGPLDKIESLRDYQLPMLTKGAPATRP